MYKKMIILKELYIQSEIKFIFMNLIFELNYNQKCHYFSYTLKNFQFLSDFIILHGSLYCITFLNNAIINLLE